MGTAVKTGIRWHDCGFPATGAASSGESRRSEKPRIELAPPP